MRLINVKVFLDLDAGKTRPDAKPLVEFNGLELTNTAYAILSHCWGDPKDEVQYTEIDSLAKIDVAGEMRKRSGYHKIRESCLQAFHDHLSWLWVDTCCIDKRSSAELSEAINSMYVWYANSDRCYAFLHDVTTNTLPAERDSIELNKFNGWPKWFSRGWTLQELIAPQDVHFFNRNWKCIASKRDSARALSVITRISVDVLEKGFSRSSTSVAQILSWAADRTTTREEDRAYSLLGLFGVHMPMLYGEGKNAFLRLQLEVIRMINDQSIFAWRWTTPIGSASGFLATDPSHFRDCSSVVRMDPTDMLHTLEGYISKRRLRRLASAKERLQTFAVTNDGILIWLPLKRERRSNHSKFFSAMLACYNSGGKRKPITITIREVGGIHFRHFGWPPEVEDRTTSIEFKSILLPYRDNIDQVNIRGPSWMQACSGFLGHALCTNVVLEPP
ncbi:heterokaryon incompatibility protein-domain-containing protein [Pisolithus thermaeus]|nr:heterokaryon incompatibility protein-domain-containing protein [Pisolithus thermaeus]